MRKLFTLMLTLATLLGLVACGNTPVPTDPSSNGPVRKCVIYNAGLASVLEAFGKVDCIVGAYGALAENYAVPSCGKWNEMDLEAVVATGADAVFGYGSYTTDRQIAVLQAAGITCHFIELSDPDTVADEIAKLGELFDCRDKAQVFVDLYARYDTLLTERLASVTPLTVYVEGTSASPKTANSTSAAHKLVTGAGLTNLYAENRTQYPERNLEDVISKDPHIIVKLCASGTPLNEATYDAYVAELAGVTAADTGRVILLNNECGTTAIGGIVGRIYVAKFAYPELFADLDVDAIYASLCADFLGKAYPGSGAYFK